MLTVTAPPRAIPQELYNDAIFADGPIAYYKLNETGGVTAIDATVNTFDMTHINSPSLAQTGPIDGSAAVTYDGTSQISIFSGAGAVLGNSDISNYSVEMFVRPTRGGSPGNALEFMACQSRSGVNEYNLSVLKNLDFTVAHDERPPFIPPAFNTTPTTISTNAWHHVVITKFDAGPNREIYLDGVQFTSTSVEIYGGGASVSLFATGGRATSSSAGTEFFEGSISNVSLWDFRLSATQVETHIAAAGF